MIICERIAELLEFVGFADSHAAPHGARVLEFIHLCEFTSNEC